MTAPDRDTVDVWVMDIDDLPPAAPHVLSEAERARAERFVRARDAERYRRVRACLRRLLAIYLGEPAHAIEIAVDGSGKPHLGSRHACDLSFNVSHAARTALIAVGRGNRIGVDVENLPAGDDIDRLAPLALDPVEIRVLDAADSADRATVFLRAWTRKEAITKAIGQGLLIDPRTISVPLGEGAVWTVLPGAGEAEMALVDLSCADFVAALAADRITRPPRLRAIATLRVA